MPALDWIGKAAILNHHAEVPYRLLHCDGALSAGDKESGNLLVQGDNLEALKALLPHYAGQVKCIYIDPPYNTGNESWVYNDNVNSPEMRRWLGKVVGKEAEDLSRHDKWLCMMYPRLRLLREFLREDGVIFISIDDNEQAHLKLLMDEIFGGNNFVSQLIWERAYAPKNDAKYISASHDYVLMYARKIEDFTIGRLPRTEEANSRYRNPDNDPRGVWKPSDLSVKTYNSEYDYPITTPSGRVVEPPATRCWSLSKNIFLERLQDNRIYFGEEGNSVPCIKRFLSELKYEGMAPTSVMFYKEVGHSQEGAKEVVSILGDEGFNGPKPVRLLSRLIKLANAEDNSLILDSFSGSGTTGHAVLAANAVDGGTRRFILIEMDEGIARGVTAQRLRRVVEGYAKNGDEAKPVAGLGGGFRFCRLGTALFDEAGEIVGEVGFADLAAHVFFVETGSPLPKRVAERGGAFIGQFAEKAVYLLYSPAAQGVPVESENNVLTRETLRGLSVPEGAEEEGASPPSQRVVYAEGCALSEEELAGQRIVFRQIPYHLAQIGGGAY